MARVGAAVTVTIPQGTLRGRKAKTTSGRPYCSFLGIPYAQPPIGPLRFKSPEPPEKWSGIRNATIEPNVAPQVDIFTKQYKGDEDCLYINIYTPKLPTGANASLIPVMVWIHGGAFEMGSGNPDFYGPDYLMEHDVVLVTFNYRLGVLGFLSTGDEVVSGNAGLKDQVMALKWVKNNIANFGGDSGNVTIFGESAGSMSCHLLLLSSAAKGLFHRAICQSGVATSSLVSQPLKDRTLRLAKFLGFSGDSSEEVVAFMREQPVQMLVENALHALSKEEKQKLETLPFVPTIEKDGGVDSILSQDPMEILKSGKFNRVPTIIGVNSREGLMFVPGLLENKSAMRDLNTNFQRLLPANVPIKREERITIARDIKRFYFENQPLEESTVDMYADLRGDLVFTYPSLLAARIQSSVSGAQPVFVYYFDAVTNLNLLKKMFGQGGEFSGASHGDDLFYLFSGEMSKEIPKDKESVEGKSIARMTQMWTNFAKTGNPTPTPDDSLLSVTWPSFKKDDRCYLEITKDALSVKKDLLKERMDFWDKLYRQ